MWLTYLRLQQGRGEEALELARDLPESAPDFPGLPRTRFMAQASFAVGDEAAGNRYLDELIAAADTEFMCVEVAKVYVALDQPDEAFEWLQRAVELSGETSNLKGFIFEEYELRPLMDEPRWAELPD